MDWNWTILALLIGVGLLMLGGRVRRRSVDRRRARRPVHEVPGGPTGEGGGDGAEQDRP